MRTGVGLRRDEELSSLDPKSHGQGGDVPNPGVNRPGLHPLEVSQVNGSLLCKLGLGQFLFEPEATDIRRDPCEGGVQ